MLQVNELTAAFYEAQYGGGWARGYLADRFGQDLAGHPLYRPGYAPAGWTSLVDHLRRHGVTDEEMTLAGVAAIARTGRLIDRFRDRAVLPITHHGQVLGFVGRRHPTLTDADQRGPKYLNTADTPLFRKGAQLYGADDALLAAGAVPVLVEGPMDAISVTLATAGSHVGVAPLGTALTEAQAAQLARLPQPPVVATDADPAGRRAAERAFWLLAQHGRCPKDAHLPEGSDPSDVLAAGDAAELAGLVDGARPLGERLLAERLFGESAMRVDAAVALLAAQPRDAWHAGVARVAAATGASEAQVRSDLLTAVRGWNADPRVVVARQLSGPRRSASSASERVAAQRHTAPTAHSTARGVEAGQPRRPRRAPFALGGSAAPAAPRR